MKRSTNVIVSNLSRDDILFSTFYTGLFLLCRKKNWGGTASPAPPLATALDAIFIKTSREAKVGGTSNQVICDQLMHNYLVIHLLE